MQIRRARATDAPDINRLLYQVAEVHHRGRPDLFKPAAKKYTDSELLEIIKDDTAPIFVGLIDGVVVGYCFCIFRQTPDNHVLTDIKTLYIDDLCVDEKYRGQKVGQKLYTFVKEFAKEQGCYNLTLNVWSCNDGAMAFYEKMGLKAQKIGMEEIL